MRKTILFAVTILLSLNIMAQSVQDVKDIIVRVNNTFQQSHPGPEYGATRKAISAFWDNAVYHTGNMEAYWLFASKAKGAECKKASCTKCSKAEMSCHKAESKCHMSESKCSKAESKCPKAEMNCPKANMKCDSHHAKQWLEYSTAWAKSNNWCGATEPDPAKWKYKNYGEGNDYVLFGDWQICFQTYLDIYRTDPVVDGEMIDYRIKRAKEVMDFEVNSGKSDYWWWADALYMVMPVFSKLYVQTKDEKYLDQMYDNWKYANSIMYDEETGLYFRDGKYVYPKHTTSAGKKDFWARGDGWVMAAFAKVLKDMPKKYKHRKEIIKYYKRMAAACISCQQQEGHWTRSMMDPEQAPGYETSGTALICYSLFWGINNGILPKTYTQAANKAWNYLSTIALQPDNTVGYVQPIGEKAIPGQVVNQKSTSNFGTGAFLLAASEYARYLSK